MLLYRLYWIYGRDALEGVHCDCASYLEEHMDMLSGKIKKCEVLFPMPMRVRVASTIRYLGTDVGDSRLCFHDYKKGRIGLAERMANLTFSVIVRS